MQMELIFYNLMTFKLLEYCVNF